MRLQSIHVCAHQQQRKKKYIKSCIHISDNIIITILLYSRCIHFQFRKNSIHIRIDIPSLYFIFSFFYFVCAHRHFICASSSVQIATASCATITFVKHCIMFTFTPYKINNHISCVLLLCTQSQCVFVFFQWHLSAVKTGGAALQLPVTIVVLGVLNEHPIILQHSTDSDDTQSKAKRKKNRLTFVSYSKSANENQSNGH